MDKFYQENSNMRELWRGNVVELKQRCDLFGGVFVKQMLTQSRGSLRRRFVLTVFAIVLFAVGASVGTATLVISRTLEEEARQAALQGVEGLEQNLADLRSKALGHALVGGHQSVAY